MAESAPRQDRGRDGQERAVTRAFFRFAISLLLTLVLLSDAVADQLGWHIFFLADARTQLVWATIVLGCGGWSGYVAARHGLRVRRVSLDLPLAGAALALYGYSLYRTFAGGGGVFFGAAAVLITFAAFRQLLQAGHHS